MQKSKARRVLGEKITKIYNPVQSWKTLSMFFVRECETYEYCIM